MRTTFCNLLAATALFGAAQAARADYVGSLGVVAAPASIGFQNSGATLTTGTSTTSNGVTYNFLDEWRFTLASLSNVSTITAAIDFLDSTGQQILFGISNLQVTLVSNPVAGTPIVSWQTVSVVNGVQQVIALTSPSPLSSGDYSLEIRGSLVQQPASYAATLIANPPPAVPIPPAFPLMALGLAALGLAARRGILRPHD